MSGDQGSSSPSAAVLLEDARAVAAAERSDREEKLQEERVLRVRACADARQRAVDTGMRRCGMERGRAGG